MLKQKNLQTPAVATGAPQLSDTTSLCAQPASCPRSTHGCVPLQQQWRLQAATGHSCCEMHSNVRQQQFRGR